MLACNIIPFIRRQELCHFLESDQFKWKEYVYIVGDIDAFQSILTFCSKKQREVVTFSLHQRLNQSIKDEHYLYQISDKKFVCIVEAKNYDFERFNQYVLDCFSKPIDIEGHPPIWIGMSGGVSVYPDDTTDVTILMSSAENALTDANEKGGNRIERYSQQKGVQIKRYSEVYQRLCGAIEEDNFDLHFQPIYDPLANKITICESLARWTDAELGQVRPDEFIAVAEKTGLMKPLSSKLFARMCQYMQEINSQLIEPIQFSYNLSRKELEFGLDIYIDQARSFPELVPNIILELTETSISKDLKRTVSQLYQLKALGYQIAIDDFGTGYSALGCLDMFPYDYIKIDKHFVDNVSRSSVDEVIVDATVSIARCLDVKVIAEGIENQEQISKLIEMGADYLQGFEICRPQPKDFLIEYLFVRQISVMSSALVFDV
ncbi:GGDEF domain-containing phosphodiesterase [uncultured Vibrio sp.]|uniref:GGDEF domain-containing phosphodiesterase n=1 Tax=uncultured Vibrio sp. TaxID=114054 RepID=UPI0025E8C07C|nr:GGDEF domain-containing phosphodiesterase [uncultured Vibrio sp.]